jgi:hypothetical protein
MYSRALAAVNGVLAGKSWFQICSQSFMATAQFEERRRPSSVRVRSDVAIKMSGSAKRPKIRHRTIGSVIRISHISGGGGARRQMKPHFNMPSIRCPLTRSPVVHRVIASSIAARLPKSSTAERGSLSAFAAFRVKNSNRRIGLLLRGRKSTSAPAFACADISSRIDI